MNPGKINDYQSLKNEKRKLKDQLGLQKELVQLEIRIIKERLSPLRAIKNGISSLVSSPEFKAQLLYTGLQLGLTRAGNLFSRKKSKPPSFLGMFSRNILWSFLPSCITAASTFIAGIKQQNQPGNHSHDEDMQVEDVTIVVEEEKPGTPAR